MKTASIDIGSNSILFLALDENGSVVGNEANVTGLGRGLDQSGAFSQVAMDESYEVFRSYHKLCLDLNIEPSDVIVTATEASRVAKNAGEFFNQIKQDFGFQVQTITGEAEAYFSMLGVLSDRNISEEFITIMDIGGASTELIKVNTQSKEIVCSFSMPMGVVRLNNWNEEGTRNDKIEDIFNNFQEKLALVASEKLYCVAGTMTSVGNMFLGHKDFVEQEVQGLTIQVSSISEMEQQFEKLSIESLLSKFPFLGKRSQTIQSGLFLATKVLNKLNVKEVYISTYGLRYGTIFAGGIKDEYLFRR